MHTVSLRVEDLAGNVTISETQVTVENVAPMLVLDPVVAIDENGIATLTGTITDPGTFDDFTMIVFWGDSFVEQVNFSPSSTGSQTFTLTHRYLDDNPSGTPQDTLTIVANLTDDDAGSDLESTIVTIHNVAPVMTGFIAGPTMAVPGQPLAYMAPSFTDVGTQDTHSLAWEVRDGANAVVATGSGSSLNFTPTTVGSYSVAFTVSDDVSGSATTSLSLSVGYASLQSGVCTTGEGSALVIGSLTVADRIHVNPQGNGGTL